MLPIGYFFNTPYQHYLPVRKTNKVQKFWLLTPVFGSLVFACLYIIATLFYAGGSEFDNNSIGFSWTQNYWCNLLNDNAINGQPNAAKWIAIAGMVVLCFSLGFFWIIFPQQTHLSKGLRLTIQISGVLSMAMNAALFTGYHDAVLMAATGFGLVAVAGTLIALQKLRWMPLFGLGIFNIALVALNNILYYGDGLRLYLPVVQKITFFCFLIWICLITIRLFNASANKGFRAGICI